MQKRIELVDGALWRVVCGLCYAIGMDVGRTIY